MNDNKITEEKYLEIIKNTKKYLDESGIKHLDIMGIYETDKNKLLSDSRHKIELIEDLLVGLPPNQLLIKDEHISNLECSCPNISLDTRHSKNQEPHIKDINGWLKSTYDILKSWKLAQTEYYVKENTVSKWRLPIIIFIVSTLALMSILTFLGLAGVISTTFSNAVSTICGLFDCVLGALSGIIERNSDRLKKASQIEYETQNQPFNQKLPIEPKKFYLSVIVGGIIILAIIATIIIIPVVKSFNESFWN